MQHIMEICKDPDKIDRIVPLICRFVFCVERKGCSQNWNVFYLKYNLRITVEHRIKWARDWNSRDYKLNMKADTLVVFLMNITALGIFVVTIHKKRNSNIWAIVVIGYKLHTKKYNFCRRFFIRPVAQVKYSSIPAICNVTYSHLWVAE